MNLLEINIDAIAIPDSRRQTTPAKVKTLAESIQEVGLLSPLTVVKLDGGYRLVAGRHRLEAMRELKWKVAPCLLTKLDSLRSELAEIDENLCRSGLTKAQESVQLARRKEIYEALYPETKRGGDKGNQHTGGKKRQNGNLPFSQNAAEKTGLSRSTVERSAALGAKLDDKAVGAILAANHPVANNQTELKRLATYTPKEQQKIAADLSRGKIQRVPEKAATTKPRKPASKPPAQEFRQVFDLLGKMKKRLDSLRLQFPSPKYQSAMDKLDQASDLLTAWQEGAK